MKKIFFFALTLFSAQSIFSMEPTENERQIRSLRNALTQARDNIDEVDNAIEELAELYEEIDRSNNEQPQSYTYRFSNEDENFYVTRRRWGTIGSYGSGGGHGGMDHKRNQFHTRFTDEFIANTLRGFENAPRANRLLLLSTLILGVNDIRRTRRENLIIVTPDRISDEQLNRIIEFETLMNPEALNIPQHETNQQRSSMAERNSNHWDFIHPAQAVIAAPLIAIIVYLWYTKKAKKQTPGKKQNGKSLKISF